MLLVMLPQFSTGFFQYTIVYGDVLEVSPNFGTVETWGAWFSAPSKSHPHTFPAKRVSHPNAKVKREKIAQRYL
jgi:hypothetical protein